MCIIASVDYGNVPTWIGSIAASLGLVFLALNFLNQSQQLRLQEKQIEDQQHQYRQDILQRQANNFSFWVESDLRNPKIHFVNDSGLPVFKVSVLAQEKESGKQVLIYGIDKVSVGFSSIPRGDSFIHSLPEGDFDLTKIVEVHFTDAAGIRWKRDSSGHIAKNDHGFDKIKRWLDPPQQV